jgi:hypothetical protein
MGISRSPELERYFPGLVTSQYAITSPQTPRYNCIAWAAADDTRWWEPDPLGVYYWPASCPREYTVDAYVRAYEEAGYRRVQQETPGDERVAIFTKDGIPQHAARELPSGQWTSKCGELEDIAHELSALEGNFYGTAAIVLARSPR